LGGYQGGSFLTLGGDPFGLGLGHFKRAGTIFNPFGCPRVILGPFPWFGPFPPFGFSPRVSPNFPPQTAQGSGNLEPIFGKPTIFPLGNPGFPKFKRGPLGVGRGFPLWVLAGSPFPPKQVGLEVCFGGKNFLFGLRGLSPGGQTLGGSHFWKNPPKGALKVGTTQGKGVRKTGVRGIPPKGPRGVQKKAGPRGGSKGFPRGRFKGGPRGGSGDPPRGPGSPPGAPKDPPGGPKETPLVKSAPGGLRIPPGGLRVFGVKDPPAEKIRGGKRSPGGESPFVSAPRRIMASVKKRGKPVEPRVLGPFFTHRGGVYRRPLCRERSRKTFWAAAGLYPHTGGNQHLLLWAT